MLVMLETHGSKKKTRSESSFPSFCSLLQVGISNFVTFLTNTAGYRRELRRVKYGETSLFIEVVHMCI